MRLPRPMRLERRLPRVSVACLCVAALTCLFVVSAANGQQLTRSTSVTIDNDYFDFWLAPMKRPDNDYSQGARVAWDMAAVPKPARRWLCTRRPACGSTMEIGQEMYTPDVDAPTPVPGERPYAGWLYASATAVGADRSSQRRIGLTLGVTGSPSLAAQAQEAFHHLVPGFRRPLGWDEQLPAELAFAARVGQSWYVLPVPSRQWLSLEPSMDALLGTLRTSARLGTRATLSLGPSHPWLNAPRQQALGFTIFGGVYGEAVAHDLFLDGSTYQSSVRVTRTPFIGEWQAGSALRLRRLAVEYRATTRSREYRTGPSNHAYGSITLRWELKPVQ